MKNTQLNKLTMFKAVRDCLTANDELVSTVEALKENSQEFNEVIQDIENTDDKKATVAVGKTDVKYEAEDTLESRLCTLSSVLAAWATSNKRLETKKLATLSETEIRGWRDEVLIHQARVLLAEAVAAGPSLARFGLPEPRLEEFRHCLSTFENALGTRTSCVAERVHNTGKLEQLFVKGTAVLEDGIDPLMELFRDSDPRFYETFHKLRVIKGQTGRSRSNADKANGNGSNANGGNVNGNGVNGNGVNGNGVNGNGVNGNGVNGNANGGNVNGNGGNTAATAAAGNGNGAGNAIRFESATANGNDSTPAGVPSPAGGQPTLG